MGARARRRPGPASAAEYLDNVLSGLGKHVMPIVEDMPHDERVRRVMSCSSTRRRDVEDTLAQLIHDEDQVVAARAIHMAAERGSGASPTTSSTRWRTAT